jgi:RNA polymerase sigma factor (sigma-70 family)
MSASPDSSAGTNSTSGVDWGECLDRHASWLRKVILARTGEPQAVDEVFQQVAVAAVEQQAPLANPEKAAPWLHRLAVIHSARFRRQRGRERRALGEFARQAPHQGNGRAGNVLDSLISAERHQQTRLALQRLAGRDAEILLLKYAERWSYRRIAERLGISEKAVDSRLLRARDRLRRELIALGSDEAEP